ncbi:MAG: ATP phosphoribosyltransferase regulatory subunit [Alphaproteobacteria bacterium]|nr:ATP phosphoribosyltransferase regulatory subunit [Alphaproteobacteria bacterium]
MNELVTRALLPAGLRDALPPEADQEAEIVWRVTCTFGRFGYARVKPPMVEFEDSLLAGSQAGMSRHCFRLMDPDSQRMMAMRADMTPQVARIAATRLKAEPRPLRLSYAGQVMRVKGDTLRPERQFGQVGAELIGSEAASADAEIIVMSACALAEVGAANVSIDLAIPYLVPAVIGWSQLEPKAAADVRAALDRKDAEAVLARGGAAGKLLAGLVAASGPVETAIPKLDALDLPPAARKEVARLKEAVGLVRAALPALPITIDAVERRGFEYQKGLSFTIFARGVRGELGRGGRYLAGEDLMEGAGETATGVTLFTDTVLRAIPLPPGIEATYAPFGTPAKTLETLRASGARVVSGLEPASDPAAEARRLGCTHVLRDGKQVAI